MRVSPYLWCGVVLLIALVVSVGLGPVQIAAADVTRILLARLPLVRIAKNWPDTTEVILLSIRLPRTVLVALTGAALGGSGATYQGLFRNPLADPYLIGIASGAGLGAVVGMAWGWPAAVLGLGAIPVMAFAGALLTVAVVYRLARVGRSTPISTLILAGVVVGSFTSALTTFLMLRSQGELRRALGWLLGGFSLGGWPPVVAVLPYIVLGLGVLIALGRPLNVLQFGDDQAQEMGLNVERVKLALVAAASLVTAAAVAFSGVIGFVGLIAPHVVRLLWGPDYRRLVPLSILAGAAGLLVADIVARLVIAPAELPTGIITALAGAPFFLYLLRTAKGEVYW